MNQTPGPTLLGFDVVLVGTILAGLAAFAVITAIYAAVTIKDPMAKRVRSLEARRDELKAGIINSGSKKRASLVRTTETTDKLKDRLGRMNVLEHNQIQTVQQKLAWAGYRNKELAVVIIGLRMVLPILLGATGFVMFDLMNSAASSSAEPPISPIMTTAFVSGSASNSERASMKLVPITGSPPIPTQVDCPSPTLPNCHAAS